MQTNCTGKRAVVAQDACNVFLVAVEEENGDARSVAFGQFGLAHGCSVDEKKAARGAGRFRSSVALGVSKQPIF